MVYGRLPVIIVVLIAALFAFGSDAAVFVTKDEALKRAFPEAKAVERHTLYLTAGEAEKIGELSGAPVGSLLFIYYRAVGGSGTIGYAVIESMMVRTKQAVVMTVIRLDGSVDRVEILAFYEPRDYMPTVKWLSQFTGRRLAEGLTVNREIRPISGATMSAHGIAREVRKALAIFEIKGKGIGGRD